MGVKRECLPHLARILRSGSDSAMGAEASESLSHSENPIHFLIAILQQR